MKILWIILGALLLLLVLLLLIALIKTLLTPSLVSEYHPATSLEREKLYSEKLSQMVRFDTVSHSDVYEPDKYRDFHKVLASLFPHVFSLLELTETEGNLLFLWKGKSSEKPVVLMSHQDTVPPEGNWTHDPFSGDIEDGKVWGRGASDTKCSLMGFFQAVEELLETGYVPRQDVYLSSSCTEEWSGNGCPSLVEILKKRNVKPYLVCDEGGGIIKSPVAGIPGNFAMVGILEKGKANVTFTAKSKGGHASAPSKNSPIARLAAFITEIEKGKMFKKKLLPEVSFMFRSLALYAGFGLKFVLCNLWLFKPVLPSILSAVSAQAGAMTKTTVAFTRQSGSEAFNSMPQEATVSANIRFIPHQGMEESLEILRKTAAKYELSMDIVEARDFTRAANIKSDAYQLFLRAIDETFPGIVSIPYVMVGASDARFYQDICDTVVRFAPVIYGPEQMDGIHGINENIETVCLPGCVDFYKNLICAL